MDLNYKKVNIILKPIEKYWKLKQKAVKGLFPDYYICFPINKPGVPKYWVQDQDHHMDH